MSFGLPRLLLGVAAASASALVMAPPARAWGDEGHEIIAAIAYPRLHSAVRRKVDAMLKGDQDPLTAPDFASRATWADKYRDSDRDTTNIRYDATREWHFVDIELDGGTLDAACHGHPPLAAGTPASAGPAGDCVVDKIGQFSTELADKATPPTEKLLALKFLLHFVGDLHQPLHAADHHDRGGNEVAVRFGAPAKTSNLHAYWDTHLVQELGRRPRSVAKALARAITPARARSWAAGGPADWVAESNAAAKSVAYDFAGEATFDDGRGGTGEQLDAAYDARALPVVRLQLRKAGVRLAAILNRVLK